MRLTDKYEMSQWAYFQCVEGNDIEEIRNLIVSPVWSWHYCCRLKNRKEIRENLNCDSWKYEYKKLCGEDK